MPFIRIWLHIIWSTKNREKLITKALKPKLLQHIQHYTREKQIFIDSVNCTSDHIHLLISLGASQSASKIIGIIKGESSHWINKSKLTKTKFEWQDEYMVYSVSESVISKVRKYIANQEEHHRNKSFQEEYSEFRKKFGKTFG